VALRVGVLANLFTNILFDQRPQKGREEGASRKTDPSTKRQSEAEPFSGKTARLTHLLPQLLFCGLAELIIIAVTALPRWGI
jgi:hypothetical protein